MEFTKPFLILALSLFLSTVASPPMKRFRAASPSASPPMKRFRAASPSAQTDEVDGDAILDTSTRGRAVRTTLGYQIVIANTQPRSVLSIANKENDTRVVATPRGKYRVRFKYANNTTDDGVICQNREVTIRQIAKPPPPLWEFNTEHGCVTVGGKDTNQIFNFVKHPDGSGAYEIVHNGSLLGLSEGNGFLVKNASQSVKVVFASSPS